MSDITFQLQTLTGRISSLEEHIKALISKETDSGKKEFLSPKCLQEEFFISRSILFRLVSKGVLTPIKLNGAKSTSIFERRAVIEALKSNGIRLRNKDKSLEE